jgi:putative transposase
MQRINKLQLKPSKKQKAILKELMLLSSCVYNIANYQTRQQFFKGEKIPNFHQLQQNVQNEEDYQLLGRSYSLPRLQIYSETTSARFRLIKSKKQSKVGLPKYLKNRKTNTTIASYLAIDGCQYSINKHSATIPLSRQMRKKYNIKHFCMPYNGLLKWQGKQQRGQIKFKDGKFYLHQAVELTTPTIKANSMHAGIDLGIKKLLTIITNSGQEKIIGSKRFFRQWQFWTAKISEEQEKLAEINRKSSNNLQRLYNKRTKWQNNLYNNLVSRLFRFAKKNAISHITVGDISNIREDADFGKKGNQMMHNYWSFGSLLQKIENKAEEFGIQIEKTTEEFTSRTCPICLDNSKSNCKDRIFICSFCGYVDHRDIVGATNILSKSLHGSIEIMHWLETQPLSEASYGS